MRILIFLFICYFSSQLFAQRGKDGAKTVNATETVNDYTSLTGNALAGNTTITVASSLLNNNFSSNLTQGDLILIYQPQGATIDNNNPVGSSNWGSILNYNEAGNYELVQVESVPNGTTIELSCGLQNAYSTSGNTFVVRVPRYSSLTINGGGMITCPTWNGSIGGIVAIEVEGTTTINAGGSIDVSGLGFRGGQPENNSYFGGWRYADNDPGEGAEKGEGIAGDQIFYSSSLAGRYTRGAAANGGGGGNGHNAGGAGGANAGDNANWNTGTGIPDPTFNVQWALETPSIVGVVSTGGGRGGYSHCGTSNNPNTTAPGNGAWGGDVRRQVGGLGGRPLDYSTGKIFMGGAGGAGDGNSPTDAGAGGNGAGIIILSTYGSVNGTGNINANGQNGFNCENPGSPGFGVVTGKDAAGGGGAGGAILIKTTATVTGVSVSANGGNGGNQVLKAGLFASIGEAEGPGGGGGGGYIAVTSGTPTTLANGGFNGVTNSTLVGGPNAANGATSGGFGLPSESIDAFDISVTGDSICENNSTTISASLTGTPPAGTQIQWYDSEFGGTLLFTGNNYTTPILSTTTIYWVKVCPAPYLVPVTVIVTPCSAPPVASFSASDSSICVDDCISFTDLSSGSPTSWNWYFFGADSTNSSQPNPSNICYSSAGSFDVALVVDNGTGIDSLFMSNFITVNSQPSVLASNDTSICIGDTANISVSGTATSYTWDNGLGIGTNFNVNPIINTTYHVVGTDGNGCSNIDSIVVSINSLPVVNASNDTAVCLGSQANISASGATNYFWDNGLGIGQNQTPTPLVNTTYIVTGTDANGCTDTSAVTVLVNPLPIVTANADSTSICLGSSVTLTGGGASSYTWNNGVTDGVSFSPLVTTLYTVTGTDANGCMNTDTITVTVNSCGNPPTASFSASDSSICIGDCIAFTDLSSGSPASWNWYFFGADSTNSSQPNPSNICYSSAGSFDVALVVDNGFGTDSLFMPNFITVNTLPIVTANADSTSICLGSSVTLTGGGASSYSWNNGITDGVSFSPLVTTLYTVTGTDVNGCVNTDTISVTVNSCGNPPSASFSASDSSICIGDCIAFTDLSSGSPTSWNWYFFGADSTNSTQQNPSNICYSSAGSFNVALVVDNGFGTDSLFIPNFITVNALPNVTANADSTSICLGSSVNLTGGGASSYSWNNGVTDGVSFSPLVTTLYTVTGTDVNGCMNTDTISVTVIACLPPIATISSSNTSLCINDCIGFTDLSTGGIPTTWNWYFESGNPYTSTSQNPTNICYDTVGTYGVSLVVSNAFGQDSIYYNNYITVDSCLVLNEVIIIPNVFSPNGDFVNDFFNPIGTFNKLHMEIYNRWGELLFKTDQPNQGWNGRTNAGAICPEGTYFYIIDIDGEIYKGTLSLLRDGE